MSGEPFRGHDDSGRPWREEDLPALGWRHRRHHDMRAAFITLAIEDGADPEIAHELTEILGASSAPAAPDAAAPDDRRARDGAPMLTSIAGGAS